VKFALAIISIYIVNVGRPSISHNVLPIPEVLRVGNNPFEITYMVGEEFGWRPTGREPGIG